MKFVNNFNFIFANILVTFLSISLGQAAGEVLPEFKTDAERNEFMIRVQRQIPFAAYNNVAYLDLQKGGLAALRKQFPNYDHWMTEKPSPLTIEIFESESSSELSYFLNDEHLIEVQRKVQALFDREIQQLVSTDPSIDSSKLTNELLKRALVDLRSTIQSSENSVRGLLVGISHILNPNERTAFLKLGDPQAQLDYLQGLNISDEELRASKFRAETLGIRQEQVTMSLVLSKLSARLKNSSEVWTRLAYLKMLLNASIHIGGNGGGDSDKVGELKKASASDYLKASDFEFAISDNDPFLQTILEEYTKQFSGEKQIAVQAIEKFQATIPRSLFNQTRATKKVLKPIAKVTEVHPYLGVHRGCIGGDCSTTNSPLFPYSPWEHDFYIQTPDGRFVGYISAARIKVNGVDSFFLRDIQGALLSPSIAEAIIHAFPNVLKHYGASQFVLAHGNFTNSQNNSQLLRSMLSHYNSQAANLVPLTFVDALIRDYIGNNSYIFKSTYNYDSPVVHSHGMLFKPKNDFQERYVYKVKTETLPVPTPRSIAEAFLSAARAILKNPQVQANEFPEIPANQLAADINALRNSGNLNLAAYYRSVDTLLEKYKIEFNRQFQEQNEDLFIMGHLKCPDAFYPDFQFLQDKFQKSKNDSPADGTEGIFFKMSERYLIQLSRQHQNYTEVMTLVQKWQGVLQKSKRFQDLVRLYSQRLLPQDVYQLVGFKAAGVDQAKSALEVADKVKVEAAVSHLLDLNAEEQRLLFANQNLPVSKVVLAHNQSTQYYQTNQVEMIWREALSAYGLRLEDIQNKRIKSAISSSIVNSQGFLSAANSGMIENIIESDITNRTDIKKRVEIINAISWILAGRNDSTIASKRLEALVDGGELIDVLEIIILHQYGSKEATELLGRPDIRKKVIEISAAFVTKNYQKVQQCADFMSAYGRLSHGKLFTLNTLPLSIQGNISSALASIEKSASTLGLTFKEFVESNDIKREIASNWMNLSDAFTNPSNHLLEISFQMLGFHLQHSNEFVGNGIWEKLITNFDYLNQKPIMRKFLIRLQELSKEDKCFNCTAGLIHLILAKKIPDNLFLNSKQIKRLIESDSDAAMTYAVAKAYKQKIPIVLTDALIARILSISSDKGRGSSGFFRPALQRFAVDIFAQLKGQRPEVQKYMQLLMQNEQINSLALRAGMAYISNGGTPNSAKKEIFKVYDRSELIHGEGLEGDQAHFNRFIFRAHRGENLCQKLFLAK